MGSRRPRPAGAAYRPPPDAETEHRRRTRAPVALPLVGRDHISDVDGLVERYLRHVAEKPSRRGEPRSPKTLVGYEYEARFAAAHLRYTADDPRLDTAGAAPGDPLRLDDPDVGL